ncbi:biotin--[acetyl-CoA-carboxylase] ligase [uncultured Fusobacterium sp.]|uniref:biotin--[acetyl-CoA-carboxylase] ligase n=1 Tax=uncultured Fusobacterium sp. TaxID=159267 RepID=UPI0025EEA338|nr:biotin--[acetyl-CoA-carboxylase] ligase [uncultured Fusobacterium sp.]
MRIFRFSEIDSTSDFLKRKDDKRDYDLVIAETQTHGRGRRGNNWVSQKGMALFSFLLKVEEDVSIEEYSKLPLVTGIAVLKGLKRIENLDFKFKWTNDIYLEDKKICGILVEKIQDFFVVGIGININNSLEGAVADIATALTISTGKKYIVEDTIFTVLDEFKKQYKRFLCGEWNFILEEINNKNYLKNREITLVGNNWEIKGIAGDIAIDGRLEIVTEKEKMFANIGEIHIKRD